MAGRKTPAADRSHGGPGSSHETEDKHGGHPDRASGGKPNAAPVTGEPTSGASSHVSGGGGERDKHHTHDPKTKR